MTKKQYNIVVQECSQNKCYHCGCIINCNKLQEINIPLLTPWKLLSDEQKQKIAELEE